MDRGHTRISPPGVSLMLRKNADGPRTSPARGHAPQRSCWAACPRRVGPHALFRPTVSLAITVAPGRTARRAVRFAPTLGREGTRLLVFRFLGILPARRRRRERLQAAPLPAGLRLLHAPLRERRLGLLPARARPCRILQLHAQEWLAAPSDLPQHLWGQQHQARVVGERHRGWRGFLRLGHWPAAATRVSCAASPPRSQPRARACWCRASRRLTSLRSASVTSRSIGGGIRVGGRAQAEIATRGAWGGDGA